MEKEQPLCPLQDGGSGGGGGSSFAIPFHSPLHMNVNVRLVLWFFVPDSLPLSLSSSLSSLCISFSFISDVFFHRSPPHHHPADTWDPSLCSFDSYTVSQPVLASL